MCPYIKTKVKIFLQNTDLGREVVAYAFNISTQKAEAIEPLNASLVYIASSRPVRPCLKWGKQKTKTKNKKQPLRARIRKL